VRACINTFALLTQAIALSTCEPVRAGLVIELFDVGVNSGVGLIDCGYLVRVGDNRV
jgi:hypothetical protein